MAHMFEYLVPRWRNSLERIRMCGLGADVLREVNFEVSKPTILFLLSLPCVLESRWEFTVTAIAPCRPVCFETVSHK